MVKRKVGYGLLGTTLDVGHDQWRWSRWRPTVAIFQQEDFALDEYHLVYSKQFQRMASVVTGDIEALSPSTKVVLHLVEFDNPWDFQEVYEKLLDFVGQQHFDPEAEDYWFNITTGTHVAQICIFLLTESRRFPGKLLQSSPIRDKKPSVEGSISVIDLDLSQYDRIADRFRKEQLDDTAFLKSGIETLNPTFNALMAQMERVAVRSREPILLTGPTGAGKSRLARRLYELRKQRVGLRGAFVEVNCATLKGDSSLSALFGHSKGSFTGAVSERKGLLKQADGGMVFLDEVGELGLDEQALLLQAIEEKRFLSLGADKETTSDFTLVCGTNRDLVQAVATGKFREDLLARINLWTFQLPGLKDRREDIAPNLNYELAAYEASVGTRVSFNKEALDQFLEFAHSPASLWKANFRDLNGAVKRMCTLAPSARITLNEVSQEIARLQTLWADPTTSTSQDAAIPDGLDEFDRIQLAGVLAICRSSATLAEAGRKLFAASRLERSSLNDSDRLRKYLARFGLEWSRIAPPMHRDHLSWQ